MPLNTYPTLPQFKGTMFKPRFGVFEKMSSNGTVRLVDQYGGVKWDLTVFHGILTQAQRNTFVSFYVANRTLQFYFTAVEDGTQRTMMFAQDAFQLESLGGTLFKVTASLREA